MKWLLGIFFGLAVLASFYADYRWKRWMAAQRAAREKDGGDDEGRK
jgi:hypothetical protein